MASNGNQLSIEELNARRRQAVLLRLQGKKLAAVTEATGLSAPTVIAAAKAYREGGWTAVEVRPRRGRPASDAAGVTREIREALIQAIRKGAPQSAGLRGHALWSRQAVGEWLASHGVSRAAGTVTRLCGQLGLDDIGEVVAAAQRDGELLRLHACERYLDTTGLLCTRASRGQLLWLGSAGPFQASHYIAFFTQLLPVRGRVELRMADSARLLRTAEIALWLRAHEGSFTLMDPAAATPPARGRIAPSPASTPVRRTPVTNLTHLQRLEAESIHIMREVVAEADKPVMLYSIGKDSAVMLHLAMKAFYPSKPPFPLLHVDTRWKFRDMYAFRDKMVKDLGLELLVHINPEGVAKNINPFTHGSAIHTDVMKTEGLKQALDKYGFDAAFGGARRDEEKSRAKERIFSFRSAQHRWDPKSQRPELWKVYNARKHKGESLRVFPLSNWTELDIWQYIHLQKIPIVPLYFAATRPVVQRSGTLIMVDDDRMPLAQGEVPMMRKVRFRTLGCYPLTGAIESEADTLPAIIQEMLLARTSERQGRVIDHDQSASMEKKKQEGYF
jgi:sulfate adenylyltransferase subunit 2